MRTKIYQINPDRDANREMFMGSAHREVSGLPQEVDPSIYDRVFNAEIAEKDLEAIYRRFNVEGHPLFRGHSLSVSDVVVTDSGAYFCDSIGFKRIPFDEDLALVPPDTLRCVCVEPSRPAYIAEVGAKLEDLQKAVGGYIEVVAPFSDPVVIVCDDEGILKGSPPCRAFLDVDARIITNVLVGTFLVVGQGVENFTSLSDSLAAKYADVFRMKTVFLRSNGDVVSSPFAANAEPPAATPTPKHGPHL